MGQPCTRGNMGQPCMRSTLGHPCMRGTMGWGIPKERVQVLNEIYQSNVDFEQRTSLLTDSFMPTNNCSFIGLLSKWGFLQPTK